MLMVVRGIVYKRKKSRNSKQNEIDRLKLIPGFPLDYLSF